MKNKGTDIFFWTDRARQGYAMVREHTGHWHLAWGHRDPPAGTSYVEQGWLLLRIGWSIAGSCHDWQLGAES